jgi:hypothetical protein
MKDTKTLKRLNGIFEFMENFQIPLLKCSVKAKIKGRAVVHLFQSFSLYAR